MVTSTVANIYAVVRRFGSSSIIGCSEKSSLLQKALSLIRVGFFQSRNEST